jgi:bifunctional DNA primase/polymerase-like protein
MQRPELLIAALRAAARGWPVFPLRARSKLPSIRGWEQRASTDAGQIRAWWSAHPASNIGLACGPAGLVVLDLDTADHRYPPTDLVEKTCGSGRDALDRLAALTGHPVPHTYAVATPAGEHLYFTAPADRELRNTAGHLGPRIDTRARGGYVVAAGSRLPVQGEERIYRLARNAAVAPLPDWLAHLLTRRPAADDARSPLPIPLPVDGPTDPSNHRLRAYLAAAVAGEARAVRQAQRGVRNHTLFRAAANLGSLVGAGLLDEDAATRALQCAARDHYGVAGFTSAEAQRTIRNGLRRGSCTPRRSPIQAHSSQRASTSRTAVQGPPASPH